MDTDRSGVISYEEFAQGYHNHQVTTCHSYCGVL